MINKSILIPLLLIFSLQPSFAQVNNTSIDKLDNNTTIVTTEDALVGEKLEKVQNQSNAGKIIDKLVAEEPKKE